MKSAEKIYVFLAVFFSILVVIGNLTYQKFVTLPVGYGIGFELSVGAMVYPLTFFISDLLAEFYGRERARFCVKLGIVMNIIAVGIIYCFDKLQATPWSKITNEEFSKVFGSYSIAFIGSVLANYTSQWVDISVYLALKKWTKGRAIWLRNGLSTGLSLFVDTFIVLSFLTFFSIIPKEQLFSLLTNSYSFKIFFVVMNIPIFYLVVYFLRRVVKDFEMTK